jgi:hypothetical protein
MTGVVLTIVVCGLIATAAGIYVHEAMRAMRS